MIPRYTPSLLSGEQLERLFAARGTILDDAVGRVREAVESSRLTHTLFVGPRGAGKTHLIALVNHRIMSFPDYGVRFRVAWLPEDPWGIRGYEGLIRVIDETAGPREAPLTVVLMENLDQVFERIGREGRQRLRTRIESRHDLLIIGSATRLSHCLTDPGEPFCDFFHIVTLEQFTMDEAIEMVTHIAEETHDEASLIQLRENQPVVRRRLTAIAHLAGGQPRIWALVATGLSIGDTDAFVEDLMSRFDDMVPYYQEQLRSLSGNEEAVVVSLIQANHPLTTRAISDMTGIGQRSLSTAVRDLRESGWIRPHGGVLTELADKRCIFYELAEPCVRIAFQVKRARPEHPSSLGVDFLAAWYGRTAGQARTSVVEAFLSVDDALAEVQATGSPEAALSLPLGVIDFLEERLAESSPAMVRLEILSLFVQVCGGEECGERVLSAMSGLGPGESPVVLGGLPYHQLGLESEVA